MSGQWVLRRTALTAVGLAAFAVIAACTLDPDPGRATASLRLSAASSTLPDAARTVMPGIDITPTMYDYTGSNGSDSFERLSETSTAITVEGLAAGDWTVDVRGYVSGVAIWQGSNTVTLTAGSSANATIDMRPDFGTGSIDFRCSWPADLGVASCAVQYRPFGGTWMALTTTPSGPEAVVATLGPMQSGSYLFDMKLYDSSAHYLGGHLDSVFIVSLNTTQAWFAIPADAIKQPPAAPTNLTTTIVDGSTVRLDWTDNSPYEIGFEVEYHDDAGSWTPYGAVGPNAASILIPPGAAGIQRSYRVRAYNNTGASYSAEVAGPMVIDFDWFITDPNLRQAVSEACTANTWWYVEQMTWLHASSRGIVSITGIERLTALTDVELFANAITDITPLSGMTALRTLYLDGNAIADTAPLATLVNLEMLCLSGTGITTIGFVSGMSQLRHLAIQGNAITDLSPLASCANLTNLTAFNNQIASVAPLSGLTQLADLSIGQNPVTDLSPLYGLSGLTSLSVEQLGITDLTFVANYLSLWRFEAYGNAITSLTPLSALGSLTYLSLGGNQITSAQPLAGLTGLTHLYLGDNDLTTASDLSGLTALRTLELSRNSITNVTPLAGLTSLESLHLYDCAVIAGVPSLVSLTNATYINFDGDSNRNIPMADRTTLTTALPGCTITWSLLEPLPDVGTIAVSIQVPGEPIVVLNQSGTLTVLRDTPVSMTATVSGESASSYEWFVNGSLMQTGMSNTFDLTVPSDAAYGSVITITVVAQTPGGVREADFGLFVVRVLP